MCGKKELFSCLDESVRREVKFRNKAKVPILGKEMAMKAACAALTGGISVLEIVMSTPGVFEVLQQLLQDHPAKTLGVGTVLNASDAKTAINAGAKFLMSPAIVKDILDDAQGSQALYIPGVMTPTEMLSAYDAGAKIVKVYPVSILGGVRYISALKRPFSHISMIASQGITIDLIGEYLSQGASSVVLSDAIFDKGAMNERNFDLIHQLAQLAALRGSEAVQRVGPNVTWNVDRCGTGTWYGNAVCHILQNVVR
ncbi:uncharacterized protein LOC130786629 isoform X4 [Actinidia eriantha]|uniref:uncharacterized protein LOC130786629 isoform X4 n=1 Tax=Actinidia eriantha TaxID=165200 RepID=UPI00258A0C7D|nr:uncharacterized protein LOC130786629 isoform X4 [Actinidia eriantha]XP_057502930.1 uncharacterized protein LOC130786629 isoform X4 [Actinidia eriantha]XP_057502931.1 uncharacterized protein LOC130786629 isoform X4 [Actinidia eriantha]